ncbi:endolytic transglycosylase MltG [Aurantimonas sp. Leaf443]|uniref:endolytic transglycosylase MltG n=1 Tax=Aurantimonas sp. Leaf443 TaxID=1736378 RepID=UPI0006FE4762|nr:endolytic transglycosylase MltG [Aurantimonas sp. Leaf443]KQT88579.1 4-amino-4-deoxychorismate lyase [Aurantimonas sp. Leaf443]
MPAVEKPRARRRRSRGARSQIVIFLNLCLTAAVFVMLGAGALAYWARGQFVGQGPLVQEAFHVVPRNSGVGEIAAGLERDGIVSNAEIFEYGVRIAGVGAQLKAGEYEFEPGISMRGVMEKLQSGESITRSVTIPEGWTVQRVFDRVAASDVLVGDMPPMVPEGTLRPDTYRVERNMRRADLIRQMASAQERLVEEIWARRDPDLPLKDIGEFITLASIVERETGIESERPHVASVFVNRLKKGMRLQSDPTFLYGVYGGAGKPSEAPVTQADIESDTPYNTYRIGGLPPGPIANPGRAALEAVANPLETKDVYFVADGTGGHVFAATLDEHNRNVRKYRALQRQQRAEAAEAAETGAAAQ